MKTLNLLGLREKIILSTFNEHGTLIKIMMIPITKEQEDYLDKNRSIKLNDKVTITSNQVFVYGECNFSEEDIAKLERCNIVPENGGWIYSGVNLETGEVTYEDRVPKQYPTFDPVIWFEYNYMLIGKPKRVLVFKCLKNTII